MYPFSSCCQRETACLLPCAADSISESCLTEPLSASAESHFAHQSTLAAPCISSSKPINFFFPSFQLNHLQKLQREHLQSGHVLRNVPYNPHQNNETCFRGGGQSPLTSSHDRQGGRARLVLPLFKNIRCLYLAAQIVRRKRLGHLPRE
jgi:hypothetical protein